MKRKRKPEHDYFVCPHCGADVPMKAAACRECGSDNETGWSQDAHVWEAGIPAGYGGDDDFDYDEFIERDLPDHTNTAANGWLVNWRYAHHSRADLPVRCLSACLRNYSGRVYPRSAPLTTGRIGQVRATFCR